MTLTKRYALVTLGIIIFLVAAPVFILGIRGYIYDFENKRLVKTAILVIKTEPKGAEIAINGPKQVSKKSNTTLRFLPGGDYDISIVKDNFHSWQKRLVVRGGVVTWAADLDKIYLLPKNPRLISETQEYKKQAPSESNYFYALEKSDTETLNIVRMAKDNREDKTIVRENVSGKSGAIYAAPNNLLFAIIDRVLYQVTTGLEYIAEGVEMANWDEQMNKLVYGNEHEINFYNPYDAGAGQRELLLRTSEAGGSFCVIPEMGYLLRSFGSKVRAVELDGRDKRNIYDLFNFDAPIQIVNCSESGNAIVIKQNDVFKTYSLRQ